MSCCDITSQVEVREGDKKIVLAGNPNVGKSCVFNALTGTYVTVSNYPGTTLEVSSGRLGENAVIDTTGVYGISSLNDEESIARDAVLSGDLVVNVVDAMHLERDLFLTQHIIDLGIPVIVALNMIDEAEKNGIEINTSLLEKELGVPVIPTIAVNGTGIAALKERIFEAKHGNTSLHSETSPDFPGGTRESLQSLQSEGIEAGDALLLLEGDPVIAQRLNREPLDFRDSLYKLRRNRVNEIVKNTVIRNAARNSFGKTLGRLMIRPLTGIPILLGTLYLLYQFLGVFVAQTLVGFTEETVMLETYEPFIKNLFAGFVDPGSFIGSLLIGEFGILTMTVTYIFGLLLPLVASFYLFLAILEDSGYLPRIAVLADRSMTRLGLNGRAVIPMLLGFGCVTMATITTRMLGSKREKIIAVFLLGLAIPCSAQLGVIAGLIAPLGAMYFFLYIGIILTMYVIAGTALNRILPGTSTDLLIDLPKLRVPRPKNVFRKTAVKSVAFIKEAGPIFAAGGAAITVLVFTGIMEKLQKLLAPVTESWLGLPAEAAAAFIMGIVRRDFGAAGLYDLALTPDQILVALVTITLFVPCIAAMLIMIKERNWKQAALIWVGSWVTAFVTGGITAKILGLF